MVFVALRRSRVGRLYAAGTLWPVKDEARASGNLRSVLWRLNQMDVSLLTVDKDCLLMSEHVVVDIYAVNAWAGRVIEGTATPAELALIPTSVEALELVPGWYDDWALLERERLRQRLLHALEAQSRQLSALGRHAEAVEAAMVAVGAEPLRESAQRVLVRAHLAEGNWVEARRCLGVYAELLDRELAARPSADLVDLVWNGPVTPR
ncbi:BTAD domain-containing putative transcriptional regulator [Nonomuraea wenchangensis]